MKRFIRNAGLNETMKSHLIDIEKFGVLDDDYETFFITRVNAISDMLKSKIIAQPIDQVYEALDKSGARDINELHAWIKQREGQAETSDTTEDAKENIQEFTDADEKIPLSDEALENIDEEEQIELITVIRNKLSKEYSIYIEGIIDGNDMIINPKGKKIPFDPSLFEDIEDLEINKLLSENLINEEQLKEYKKHLKLERYSTDFQHQERQLQRTSNEGGRFSFDFKINKSFLESGYLTIPKEFNSHLMGTAEQKDSCDVSLVSINGTLLGAYLYHGESGWGRYFQLRIKNKPGFIYDGGLEHKEIDNTIQVIFDGDINQPKFLFK